MSKIWRQYGYEDFSVGTFGNGRQNIYVSKAGILQRIFHFDFNQNGYTDALIVNSQNMGERLPAYIYSDVLGKRNFSQIPSNGAYAAALADLNNDGFDDLVIAHQHNGTHADLTAFVYYGSPEGLTERYKIELPAPNCRAVAIGDFNGDGFKDIAFASDGKLRIFYQCSSGFRPSDFKDYDIEVTHLSAGDIDGDGIDELYVRVRRELPKILWGSIAGINLQNATIVGQKDETAKVFPSTTPGWDLFAEGWVPRILKINGRIHLFRPEEGKVHFIPFNGRSSTTPIIINCSHAVSAAAGDLNIDGIDDIAIAVCEDRNKTENSLIFWADKKGFTGKTTTLPTVSAREILIADLDNSGKNSIVICQGRTDLMNTTESLIFPASQNNISLEPIRITTHDATTTLVGHTSDNKKPQLIFINHVGGRFRGDISAYLYYNGPKGFSHENRAELPGWSAPAAIGCDFNDDGWADILICNCAENAFHLDPGSFLYWGSKNGFNPESKLIIPTLRAHGCAVGDFRKSGFLDVIFGGCGNPELLIYRGNKNGFDLKNPQKILMDPKHSITSHQKIQKFLIHRITRTLK